MNIIEQANYYMNILIFATILIVAVLAALLYYFIKVRKVIAAEEKINYENFERASSMDYLKFDDIVSDSGGDTGLGGAGMIIMDGTTFVTGIDIVGYNYEHASAGERQRTMINAIGFANIIEQPIQLRQTVEAIDIGSNIEQFMDVKTKIVKELVELKESYSDMVLQAESRKDEPEVLEVILANLQQLEKQMDSMEWKLKEADNVIRYEKLLQERSSNTDKNNQLLFSYRYNPNEFTEELTEEEIKIKAMIALKTKIGIYSSALENCGCSCRPLDENRLVDLIWHHMHPNTADMVDIKERLDFEIGTLFITSDSLFELEKEKIGEDAFLAMMEEAEATYKDQMEEAEAIREDEVRKMEELTNRYNREIITGGYE